MKKYGFVIIIAVFVSILILFSCTSYLNNLGSNPQNNNANSPADSYKRLAVLGGGYLSTDEFNEKSPFLFRYNNNAYLFFDSDRTGNYDIYFAQMNSDGIFNPPVSLTNIINTTNNEESPILFQSGGNTYISLIRRNPGRIVTYQLNNNFDVISSTPIQEMTNINVSNIGLSVLQNTNYLFLLYGTSNVVSFVFTTNWNTNMLMTGAKTVFAANAYEYQANLSAVIYQNFAGGVYQITGAVSITNKYLLPFAITNYNSTFNDITPFVDVTGGYKVYFASDRFGKGNYDLYRYNDITFDKIINGININQLTNQLTNLIDTTPPEVLIFTPTNNQSVGSTYAFSGSVTDTGSGLSNLYVELDTNGFLAITVAGTNWLTNFSVSLPGLHTNYVYAVDNSGNISAILTNYVNVAADLPFIGILSPLTGLITNATSINFSGTNSISSYYSITNVLLVKNDTVTNTMSFTANTWNSPVAIGLNEGSNTFQAIAYGITGKTGLSGAITVILDTTPPVLTITSAGSNTNGLYTFSGAVTDAVSGVSNVYVKMNTNTFTPLNINVNGPWSTNFSLVTFGTNVFYAYAVDKAGNITVTNSIIVIYSDVIPPTVSIATIPAYTNTASFTVNTTITDTGTGVSNKYYKLGSGSALTFTGSIISLSNLTESNYTIYVWAQDSAGNTSLTQSASFTVDTMSPFLIPNDSSPITINGTVYSFIGTASDSEGIINSGIASVNVSTDDISFIKITGTTNWTNIFTFSDNSSNNIWFYCMDGAGNSSYTNQSAVYVVASVVYVATNGNDGNPGISASPLLTIQNALDTAVTYGLTNVYVQAGVYITNVGLSGNWNNGLSITSSRINLAGGWDSSFSIVSGKSELNGQNYQGNIISVQNATNIHITGFVLENGHANSDNGTIGAGIYLENVVNSVFNLVITNNTAYDSGGGVYMINSSSNNISGLISVNTAQNCGGGIFITNGISNIISADIISNSVTGNNVGCGGGIYITGGGNNTVNSKILMNSANSGVFNGGGGGIYMMNSDHNSIGGSVSTNAYSVSSAGPENGGGGIYLSNCSGNTITADIVSNGIFCNNFSGTVLGGGGLRMDYGSNNTITAKISNNSANGMGGGIYIYYSGSNFINSIILNNYLNTGYPPSGGGGGIILIGANDSIISGNISVNNVVGMSAFGGGVSIFQSTNINITATIANNTSLNYGGGLYINYASNISVSSDIMSNNSLYDGGGIYIINSLFGNISGNIAWNTAAIYGGGIYINYSTNFIFNSLIMTNSTYNGGGIYVDSWVAFITNNGTITSNTAANYGGGLFYYMPIVNNGTIINNTAVTNPSSSDTYAGG